MQQLLVPIEDGQPSGNPITADNLRLVYPNLPNQYLRSADIADLGFAPFAQMPRPLSDDPALEYIEHPPVEQNSDLAWVQNWQAVPVEFADNEERGAVIQNYLLQRLSDIRWRREVAGIPLQDGTHVRTDDKTQSRLTSVLLQVQSGALTEVRWKMSDGQFVTLPGAQLAIIAGAVGAHVAACFAAEEAVAAQIAETTTVEDLRAIDIQAAFNAALTNAQ